MVSRNPKTMKASFKGMSYLIDQVVLRKFSSSMRNRLPFKVMYKRISLISFWSSSLFGFFLVSVGPFVSIASTTEFLRSEGQYRLLSRMYPSSSRSITARLIVPRSWCVVARNSFAIYSAVPRFSRSIRLRIFSLMSCDVSIFQMCANGIGYETWDISELFISP